MRLLLIVFIFNLFLAQPSFAGPSLFAEIVSENGEIPIKGAAVKIDDQQSMSDRNGKIRFSGLPFGQIFIEIQANKYKTYRNIIRIEEGENFYTFKLKEKNDLISITGITRDKITSEPVQGVHISIGTHINSSDSDGKFQIDHISKGKINLIASKAGFIPFKIDRICSSDTFIPINLIPIASGSSLKGKIIDSETKLALSEANIIVDKKNIKPDKNGTFFIKTLEKGIHIYTVSCPGYLSYKGNFMVSKKPVMLNIKLRPIARMCKISGVVCDENGIPIPSAVISISRKKTISSGTGEFHFDNIRQGIYEISCKTDDFLPYSQKIALSQPFESKKIILSKKRLMGKLKIIIRDRLTNFPLSKVYINVESLDAMTSKSGEATISYLSYGTHEIAIKAAGFYPLNTKINISRPFSISEFLLDPVIIRPNEKKYASKKEIQKNSIEFSDVKNIISSDKEKVPKIKNTLSKAIINKSENTSVSVEGKIIDDKKGVPLKNVIISIGNKTVKSDKNGYYHINILHGDYEIMALADHYKIYRHDIHLSDQRVVFNMRLESNTSFVNVTGRIIFSKNIKDFRNITVKLGNQSTKLNNDFTFSFSMVKTDFYSITVLDSGNVIFSDDILISEENHDIDLEI